jgi:hypothetical protein
MQRINESSINEYKVSLLRIIQYRNLIDPIFPLEVIQNIDQIQ